MLKPTALAALLFALAPAISQASDALPVTASAVAAMPSAAGPSVIPMSPQVFAKLPTADAFTYLPKADKPALAASVAPLSAAPLSAAALGGMASADGVADTNNIWDRIRTGYAIPDVNDQLVAKHIEWYSSRPDYIARTTARA